MLLCASGREYLFFWIFYCLVPITSQLKLASEIFYIYGIVSSLLKHFSLFN